FDYPRNNLWVRKAENFYAPFEFDMSGMSLKKIPNDENRIYISEVRIGSPAHKAGILNYDEILTINKVPTFIWELGEVNTLLPSTEGKKIEIEIRRYVGDDITKWTDHKFAFELKKQI